MRFAKLFMGLFLVAGALASAGESSAQGLYKNVMPDGRIIYSDQPLKGAKQSKALELPPPPTAEQKEAAQKRAEQEKRTREELLGRLEERRKAGDAADSRVNRARKALEDAQTALEKGREPQGGDMSANIGGGARPNEGYFRRIADLERAVENARKELEVAQRERINTR